jgi:hypothetical protein
VNVKTTARLTAIVTLTLMLTFSVGTVNAYEWNSERYGWASRTTEWGSPYESKAEYTPHTLKLGSRCIVLGSATAKGSMYICGVATTTGWVRGYISWYMRGYLFAGGLAHTHASVTVKFQAIDNTASAKAEKVVFHMGAAWSDEGTWYLSYMDIPLYNGHSYEFHLYAEVHADSTGLGGAVADYGIDFQFSDSRIEWGFIDVPYVTGTNQPFTPSICPDYTAIPLSYASSVGVTRWAWTTDIDGDNIRYQFDWGDGTTEWTVFYPSGYDVSRTHKYSSSGLYTVKVRAQDDTYGPVTAWSSLSHVSVYSGGGGGCPTLFVWSGSEYVEETTLDIHGDSDVTLQHRIEQPLAPEKNSYKLSLRELDEFTSHIDYVKLYVVGSDGEMYGCHLKKAVHSELEDVKEQLLQNDDIRVNLEPSQMIDLELTVPNISEIAYFIFEIDGHNTKRPW